MKTFKTLTIFLALYGVTCCSHGDAATNDLSTGNKDVPAVYKKIYGASSITADETYIYIKTNGAPDHKSAYYPQNHSLYESFSGTTYGGYTFNKNPNTISLKKLHF